MIALTQTAQAGITPTETSVGTVTPTGTPSVYAPLACGTGSASDIVCAQLDDHTISFHGGNVEHPSSIYLAFDAEYHVQMYLKVNSNADVFAYLHVPSSAAEAISLANWGGAHLWFGNLATTHSLCCGNGGREDVTPGDQFFEFQTQNGGNQYINVYANDVHNIVKNLYIGAGATIILSSSPTFNAAPTPVPTPSGYCATIQGTDALGIDSEFALPVPHLGAKTCPVNYDGLDVELFSILGLPDVHIPSIQICFQDITFGTLKYYGMDLDIDYLAYILAAALIVAMFTRGR